MGPLSYQEFEDLLALRGEQKIMYQEMLIPSSRQRIYRAASD